MTTTDKLSDDEKAALRAVSDGKLERMIPAEHLRKLLDLKLIQRQVNGFKPTVRGRAALGRPVK